MTADEPASTSLAAERTVLAWNRTGLAFLTIAGVAAKALPSEVALASRVALVALATLLGLAAWGYGFVGHRLTRAPAGEGRTPLADAAAPLLTAGTALLAGVAIVVALS